MKYILTFSSLSSNTRSSNSSSAISPAKKGNYINISQFWQLGCGMEAKEINITYETLFEILKREKDTADLQKLDLSFFDDFVEYLNEKKKLLEKEDSLFSYDEKKKVEKQIDNARRIIKDIYERREKKIMGIALIKSRTKSDVMDKSAFLEHEKRLWIISGRASSTTQHWEKGLQKQSRIKVSGQMKAQLKMQNRKALQNL